MWLEIKNHWFDINNLKHIQFSSKIKVGYFQDKDGGITEISFDSDEEFNKAKETVRNKFVLEIKT